MPRSAKLPQADFVVPPSVGPQYMNARGGGTPLRTEPLNVAVNDPIFVAPPSLSTADNEKSSSMMVMLVVFRPLTAQLLGLVRLT